MLAHNISDATAYVEEFVLSASPAVQGAEFLTHSKALAVQAKMTTTKNVESTDPYGAESIFHW